MKLLKKTYNSALAHTALIAAVLLANNALAQTAPPLGLADTFAVLAGSTVTNTGATTIVGDVGVSPGTAITGFPPAVVSQGIIRANDGIAAQAQGDLLIAYNHLAKQPVNTEQAAALGSGMVLTPGVYHFTSAANLTGSLVLDAKGDPNALFIFQIEEALTVANDAQIILINSAAAHNVYWRMGTSATLGTNVRFMGNLLAGAGITMNTGASVTGRALAQTAVTLDTNSVILSKSPPLTGAIPPVSEVPPVKEESPPKSENPPVSQVPPVTEENPPKSGNPPPSGTPPGGSTLSDMDAAVTGGGVTSATIEAGGRTNLDRSYRSKFTSGEHVIIEGEITPEPRHVGEALDVFVVVHKTTPSGEQIWLYRNLDGVFVRWDGVVASLQPTVELAAASSEITGLVYSGRLLPGVYTLYLGYQAEGGALTYSRSPLVMSVTD